MDAQPSTVTIQKTKTIVIKKVALANCTKNKETAINSGYVAKTVDLTLLSFVLVLFISLLIGVGNDFKQYVMMMMIVVIESIHEVEEIEIEIEIEKILFLKNFSKTQHYKISPTSLSQGQ